MGKVKDVVNRNAVVVFYRPDCGECAGLKQTFKKFGEEFPLKGLANAYAVNCEKRKEVCRGERVRSSLPKVVYYGPKGHPPKSYLGVPSFDDLKSWFQNVMGDFCTQLSDSVAMRSWLSANDTVPHVALISDRRSTPPLMKALSIEFKNRVAVGVVLMNAKAELARKLGVKKRPALLHIVDESTFSGDSFDKQFTKEAISHFLSKAVDKHRSGVEATVRELTEARYNAGDCAPTDSKFCLLLHHADGVSNLALSVLRQLVVRLRHDPVKVFFVKGRVLSRAFNWKPGDVILYRPKRKRFKVFDGDITDPDKIYMFVDAAVGGGSPLPNVVHVEPKLRDEF